MFIEELEGLAPPPTGTPAVSSLQFSIDLARRQDQARKERERVAAWEESTRSGGSDAAMPEADAANLCRE